MLGICGAPDDAYQILRGLRTMGLRLERHYESALDIAEWLEGREDVARVLHPALPSFPSHHLWKRDFKGASGIFSFVLAADGPGEVQWQRRMPSSTRSGFSVSVIPGRL